MKSPQFVAGCAWVLSGLLMSVPATADQGPRHGEGAARRSWMHKLDRGLQRVVEGGARRGHKTRVIIRTRPGAEQAVAKRVGAEAGAKPFALELVRGLHAEVREDELEGLAGHPDIDGISLDAPVHASQSSTEGCWTWTWGACGSPSRLASP